MAGIKINLGKSVKVKDGKIEKAVRYHDASAAIRSKKSKKQRPQKRIV